MAKLCTFLFVCSLFFSAANAIEAEEWFQKYLSQPQEKVAKFRFYVQDNLSGPDATVWEVARSQITANSSSSFGQVSVVDDLITAGPDRNSEKWGRAQGLITNSDLQTLTLAMNLNFVFTSGPYNGSSLCILGRNAITTTTRELAVVGGTGVFRMARGFAITNTYSFDFVEIYGVLEYNVHVVLYA